MRSRRSKEDRVRFIFTGWVLFVVVGIPLHVLLEALGEALVSERLFSERIGRRIPDKDFSGARILYGVVVGL